MTDIWEFIAVFHDVCLILAQTLDLGVCHQKGKVKSPHAGMLFLSK